MDARTGRGVLLALVALALYWATCNHQAKAQQGDNAEATKQAIIARERAHLKALNDDNAAFFDDFFTDDFSMFTEWSNDLDIEPKVRENVQTGMRDHPGLQRNVIYGMAREHVQLYGDTAILTYNLSTSYTSSNDGHTVSNLTKETDVYVRQKGVWRLAHTHGSSTPARPFPLSR